MIELIHKLVNSEFKLVSLFIEPYHTTVFKLIIVLKNALSTQQVGWLVVEIMASNGDAHILKSREWRKITRNPYKLQS